MINFVMMNKEFFGIAISFLTVAIPLMIFLISKSKEQHQLNFDKFHNNLMRDFSNQGKNMGLDQQVAIVYELKNYPEYYPVIRRILIEQIERWKIDLKAKPEFKQLINEANMTIAFTNMNALKRFLYDKWQILSPKSF